MCWFLPPPIEVRFHLIFIFLSRRRGNSWRSLQSGKQPENHSEGFCKSWPWLDVPVLKARKESMSQASNPWSLWNYLDNHDKLFPLQLYSCLCCHISCNHKIWINCYEHNAMKHCRKKNVHDVLFSIALNILRCTEYCLSDHCQMCTFYNMFSFQLNKPRHILRFVSWYSIYPIFFPACSVGRKTWFLRKPCFSDSKFWFTGYFDWFGVFKNKCF